MTRGTVAGLAVATLAAAGLGAWSYQSATAPQAVAGGTPRGPAALAASTGEPSSAGGPAAVAPDVPAGGTQPALAPTAGAAAPAAIPVLAAAAPSSASSVAVPAERAPSLQGTQVDGGLHVDGAGRFVPTLEARLLFDHLLSASGEESPAVLRARLELEIRRRLPPAAAGDALALLERYLGYRERVRALAAAEPAGTDVEARLDRLWQLRREVFGPADADALFGDERELELAALEARRAASQSPADRARALAESEARLPEPLRQARQDSLAPLRLLEAEQAARAKGAGAAEVQRLREQAVGKDAADRLAKLDAQQQAFAKRLADYRAAKAALAADSSLDAARRAEAEQALLRSRFGETERLRVQALERLAAGGDLARRP